MAKYEEHQFYCLLCGKPGIPLRRNVGWQHGSMHRKKLYCPWCAKEVNCIETRNLEEKELFLAKFNAGEYEKEAKESLDFLEQK